MWKTLLLVEMIPVNWGLAVRPKIGLESAAKTKLRYIFSQSVRDFCNFCNTTRQMISTIAFPLYCWHSKRIVASRASLLCHIDIFVPQPKVVLKFQSDWPANCRAAGDICNPGSHLYATQFSFKRKAKSIGSTLIRSFPRECTLIGWCLESKSKYPD